MATSVEFSTSNTHIKYKIEVTEGAYSVENNTSPVRVRVLFYRTNTGYETYGTGTVYVKIAGTQYSQAVTTSQRITSSDIYLFDKTVTVTHDADGSKKIYISAWINHNAPLTSSEQGSNFTLATIPMASQPSCVTWPTTTESVGNIGDTFTIHMNSKSSGFRHTVYCMWYGRRIDIATNVQYNCQFQLDMSMCGDVKSNPPIGTGTIHAVTYNGSTQIGTKSVTFKATVPDTDSTRPTVDATLTANNDRIPSGTKSTFAGLYIQGISKVSASITASGKYSASITERRAMVEGKSYTGNIALSSTLSNYGDEDVVLYATDSRGYVGSATKSISVIPYSAPEVRPIASATEVKCYRANADGTPNGGSTTIWIKAKRKYSPVSQNNKCTLRYRYKLATASAFGGWQTLIAKNTTTTDEFNALIQGTFPVTNAYRFEIGVMDDLGGGETSSVFFDVPTDDVALHLARGGKNVGLGMYANTDKEHTVSVGWETMFFGNSDLTELPNRPSPYEHGAYQVFVDGSDKYYWLIDWAGGFFTGVQLNGASEINWREKT